MAYLLDTNVVADLVRNPQGAVVEHVRRVGEVNVCTSVIAAAELRFGAEKKGSGDGKGSEKDEKMKQNAPGSASSGRRK